MKDVETRFKPEIGPCPCSCGVEARPLSKQSRDGLVHVRGCKCASCRGRKSRAKGHVAQRQAARSLGIMAMGAFLPSNEEQFPGELRVEVKSGTQVKPMDTAFQKARKQSEAARPIGDNRPCVIVAKVNPSGKDGIVAFRQSDLQAVAYSLAKHFGFLDD